MSSPDHLSAFLHTEAWAQVVSGVRNDSGEVWKRLMLPRGVGSYLLCTRAAVTPSWKLPSTKPSDWFIRIQADSVEGHQHILALAKENTYAVERQRQVQPNETVVLDVSQNLDALLANMKQKHRYNISLAARKGITVRISKDLTEADFETFFDLLTSTATRQGISLHSASHYKRILKHHPKAVWLAFAEYEGKAIATCMVLLHKQTATYLHGGSDYTHRDLMAPYALHWEVIQKLHKEAFTHYDLWGVHTHEGKPVDAHPSAGTTRFKLGFGGSLVSYPPTIDIVLKPLQYAVYKTLLKLLRRNPQFS